MATAHLLTKQSNHCLSLFDFKWSTCNEVQHIQTFAVMNDSIPRRHVRDPEVARNGALYPGIRVFERGITLKNYSVEMHAYVGL